MSGSSTRSAASVVADPRPGPGRRAVVVAAVAALVVAVDQLTKWWATERLADGPIEVVWTLQLRLIRNFGGSFGVGQGRGTLISVIGIAVTVGLLVAAVRTPRPTPVLVAFGCFIGGAVGNIADRVLRAGDGPFGGGVVDFIDFGWWPVFNLADVFLYVGVGLLVIVGFGDEPDDDPSTSAADVDG